MQCVGLLFTGIQRNYIDYSVDYPRFTVRVQDVRQMVQYRVGDDCLLPCFLITMV
jgi:hypothetical protein